MVVVKVEVRSENVAKFAEFTLIEMLQRAVLNAHVDEVLAKIRDESLRRGRG